MKSFLLILVLCTPLLCALPVLQSTEEATEKDTQLVEKYLDTDYPQEEPIHVSRIQFNNVNAEQIQQTQDYFGPEATQKMDLNTLDVTKRPRCGVSDLQADSNGNGLRKWNHTDLTYRFVNYTPDIARADVEEAFEGAFKMWSDVTPLTFKEVFNSTADIMITFAYGVHSDYFSDCPFDGKGNTLAHASYPYSGFELGGVIHFDEGEHWTKTTEGTKLELVAAHEIGHSLGLSHSENGQSLMFRSYNPTISELQQEDIYRIQALYGRPEDGHHWQTYQSSPGKPLAEETGLDWCDTPLDAVATYKERILFFIGEEFIEKDLKKNRSLEAPISCSWSDLGYPVDASYEAEGLLYFFKGSTYCIYNKHALQENSSIYSLGFKKYIQKIDAAAYNRETKTTLFFSGDEYWSYYPAIKFMSRPIKIIRHFPKIGNKVDAAFQYNERLYLIRDNFQYEFDSKTYQFIGLKKVNTWFGC